jgi:hypothetical protein
MANERAVKKQDRCILKDLGMLCFIAEADGPRGIPGNSVDDPDTMYS